MEPLRNRASTQRIRLLAEGNSTQTAPAEGRHRPTLSEQVDRIGPVQETLLLRKHHC